MFSPCASSLIYSAPEILTAINAGKTPSASKKAELFSLGLILYYIATGTEMFESESEAKKALTDEKWCVREDLLHAIGSGPLREAIRVCV